VLSVPVQAIVQVKDETSCFVDVNGQPQRHPIALGRTNDKFVEVTRGLQEGDRVVLNPMAIVDETREAEEDQEEQETGNELADTPNEQQEAKTEVKPAESPRPARKPAPGKTRQQRKPSAKP
jgi:hypothetical protein